MNIAKTFMIAVMSMLVGMSIANASDRRIRIHNMTHLRIVELYGSPIDDSKYRYNMIQGPSQWIRAGEPQIVHFGEDEKKGYTLVQLIETSNICAHFSEDTNNFYLNVFSCKSFDKEDVMDVVKEYFKPKTIDHFMISRG